MQRSTAERRATGRGRKAFRVLAGLSNAELARRAGISRPTLTRVERGEDVEEETLRKVAAALRVEFGAYASPRFDVPALAGSRA